MPDESPEPHESPPPVVVRPATPLETRWPCPVCIAVAMQKVHVDGEGGALTLDHCDRCGGLWFERGEVGRIAARPHDDLHRYVPARAVAPRPPCHGCGAPLDRDAARCPVCGTRNVLHCPQCDLAMERRERDGLVLDFCTKCHGVWFDHAEIAAIWRMNLAQAAERRGSRVGEAGAVAGDVMVNAMFWTPDLVVMGGSAVVHGAGAAAEVVGEAAAGVFETLVEIISSLFE